MRPSEGRGGPGAWQLSLATGIRSSSGLLCLHKGCLRRGAVLGRDGPVPQEPGENPTAGGAPVPFPGGERSCRCWGRSQPAAGAGLSRLPARALRGRCAGAPRACGARERSSLSRLFPPMRTTAGEGSGGSQGSRANASPEIWSHTSQEQNSPVCRTHGLWLQTTGLCSETI